MDAGTSEDLGSGAPDDHVETSGGRSVVLLVVHLAVVAIAIGLVAGNRLNPRPVAPAHPTSVTACSPVLTNLVHLSLLNEKEAAAALARWDECDAQSQPPRNTRKAALKALGPNPVAPWDTPLGTAWLFGDLTLIVVIGCGLVLAIACCWMSPRWRRAAYWIAPLVVLYVTADLVENALLYNLLRWPSETSAWLPWAAAIKFGALAGAAPIFVVSLALATADAARRPSATRTPTPLRRAKKLLAPVASRIRAQPWAERIEEQGAVDFVPIAAPQPSSGASSSEVGVEPQHLGIACSGGGIRSAAFNLGALQALSEPVPDDLPSSSTSDPSSTTSAIPSPLRDAPPAPPRTELSRARWLSAVSGGSYIAAAWVTARKLNPDAWSRCSPEEQHLRRHASYLAPGLAGKLWAFTRFVLGFVLNLGLVTLALGFVFLPFGWAVNHFERDTLLPSGGDLTLPMGGCFDLPNGDSVHSLDGIKLQLSGGTSPTLDPVAPPRLTTTTMAPSKTKAHTTSTTTSAPTGTNSSPRSTTTPCDAHGAMTDSGGLRAAAPGHVLKAGTDVVLKVTRPLLVQSHGVAGCGVPNPATTVLPHSTTTSCPPEIRVFPFPPGTRLVEAPTALLTLPAKTVVGADGALLKACGVHPCSELVVPGLVKWALGTTLALFLVVGFAMVAVHASNEASRRIERLVRRLSLAALYILAVGYLLPLLVVWAENGRWWLADREASVSGFGLGAVLAALGVQLLPFVGASKLVDTKPGKVIGWVKQLGTRTRPLLVWLAGAMIGPAIVLSIAIGFASYAAQQGHGDVALGIGNVAFGIWLGLAGPLLVILVGADLNQWSLHPYYRDRLQTAFAVDVRNPAGRGTFRDESLVDLPGTPPQPELVICAAVNIADDRMTPPGRPVASWVFGKHVVGSKAMSRVPKGQKTSATGTFPSDQFPKGLAHLGRVWTAVAVSGAAFAPSMGKMNRPERFLLALGNLRLGVWYPNPRYLGVDSQKTWYAKHRTSPGYLAKEALGLHHVNDRWVYVTDGGHYENLGLRELLNRHPKEIYCFDASGDSPDTFGTLADAMRLAREEDNIEIDLRPPKDMHPDSEGVSKIGLWAGTVTYADKSQAWLVIAKLSVPSTAPFDIIDLARTLPSFPNHPTADQLYTDQKFEAYRALGHHLGAMSAWVGTHIRIQMRTGSTLEAAVAEVTSTLPAL